MSARAQALRARGGAALFSLGALGLCAIGACEDGGSVLIGIDTPSPGSSSGGAGNDASIVIWPDAAAGDADFGACAGDGGCPAGSVCSYPIEAGCTAAAECVATTGSPVGPLLVLCGLGRSCPYDSIYTSSAPDCDAGDGDQIHPADASAP